MKIERSSKANELYLLRKIKVNHRKTTVYFPRPLKSISPNREDGDKRRVKCIFPGRYDVDI